MKLIHIIKRINKFSPVALVDIDGVILNIEGEEYCNYNDRSKDDRTVEVMMRRKAKPDITTLLSAIQKYYTIFLVTARPARFAPVTIDRLNHYSVGYNALFMREDEDTRHDSEIKESILDHPLVKEHEINLVLEDRNSVVAMWRFNGLTCLQVSLADY